MCASGTCSRARASFHPSTPAFAVLVTYMGFIFIFEFLSCEENSVVPPIKLIY